MSRSGTRGGSVWSGFVLIGLALSGCQGDSTASTDATSTDAIDSPAGSETNDAAPGSAQDPATFEVIETLNRAPSFTQGLELLDDGRMLHSRGRYGESGIDILSPTGAVLRSRDLPDDHFGEGLTVVPDADGQLTAYQLTWKSGVVHTWSLPDLVEGPSLQIEGDGWGLCYDETRDALWQSDGTSTLRLLAVPDLAPIAEVNVTEQIGDRATPVQRLNELECDQGRVWANVWQSEDILLIEPPRGDAAANKDTNAQVLQRVSLSRLVEGEGHSDPDNVLNGVALEEQDGSLLVTGKNWERIFRIALAQE